MLSFFISNTSQDGASSSNIHFMYFTQETAKLAKLLYQLSYYSIYAYLLFTISFTNHYPKTKFIHFSNGETKIKHVFYGCQTNRLDMRKTDSIIKNAFKRFYTKQNEIYCFGSKNPQNPLYF